MGLTIGSKYSTDEADHRFIALQWRFTFRVEALPPRPEGQGFPRQRRHEMDEALVIKPGFATPDGGKQRTKQEPKPDLQLSLAVERRATYQA